MRVVGTVRPRYLRNMCTYVIFFFKSILCGLISLSTRLSVCFAPRHPTAVPVDVYHAYDILTAVAVSRIYIILRSLTHFPKQIIYIKYTPANATERSISPGRPHAEKYPIYTSYIIVQTYCVYFIWHFAAPYAFKMSYML